MEKEQPKNEVEIPAEIAGCSTFYIEAKAVVDKWESALGMVATKEVLSQLSTGYTRSVDNLLGIAISNGVTVEIKGDEKGEECDCGGECECLST